MRRMRQLTHSSILSRREVLARLEAHVATNASFDSAAEQYNLKCLPNTRVELLGRIAAWSEDSDDKLIFCLKGMAGTGK